MLTFIKTLELANPRLFRLSEIKFLDTIDNVKAMAKIQDKEGGVLSIESLAMAERVLGHRQGQDLGQGRVYVLRCPILHLPRILTLRPATSQH